MKISFKHLSIFLTILVLAFIKIQAQVVVILQQPPPNQLNISDLWKLTLNNTGSNSFRVYLEGTVDEEKDGRILEGKSQVFDLPKGIKIITSKDVSAANITYKNNKYKEIILRTGNPPSGNYTICISVMTENGTQIGNDCKNQYINNLSPPVLISPSDGDSVNQKSLTFTWTPPTPISSQSNMDYSLKIVEILGNQSLSEAIDKNTSFFEQAGIHSTIFQYPVNGIELKDNQSYAWQISANINGSSVSRSQPSGFIASTHLPGGILQPHILLTVNPTISSGFVYASALMPDQTLSSWGQNSNGELGFGGGSNEPLPNRIPGLNEMLTVSAGEHHTLALKNDGTVWAWGTNNEFELGNTVIGIQSSPVQVTGISDVVAVSTGLYHSLALKRDGTVWAWGSNVNKALGDGSEERNNSDPRQLVGLSNIVNISAGESHSLALRRDGTVWSWGSNRSGNLGNGSEVEFSASPVQVSGLSDIIAISEGKENFSYALKRDGTVWSWGDNVAGKLGDGTTSNRNTPVQVIGITDAVEISAGFSHALVLKRDGTIWGCGDNNFNQLGRGHDPTLNSSRMIRLPYLGDGYVEISAGGLFSLALKNDGTIWAWGDNGSGDFGIGSFTESITPVQVLFTH